MLFKLKSNFLKAKHYLSGVSTQKYFEKFFISIIKIKRKRTERKVYVSWDLAAAFDRLIRKFAIEALRSRARSTEEERIEALKYYLLEAG